MRASQWIRKKKTENVSTNEVDQDFTEGTKTSEVKKKVTINGKFI